MIPPFNSLGVLPPTPDRSPYVCTVGEMEARFVDDLPGAWRREWFDGWDILRRGLAMLAPSGRWWIWGDFVTSMSEPIYGERGAMLTALIIDNRDLLDAGGAVDLVKFTQIRSARMSAEELHRVDLTDVVIEFEPSDRRFVATEATMGKSRRRASRTMYDSSREQTDAGFIEVLP